MISTTDSNRHTFSCPNVKSITFRHVPKLRYLADSPAARSIRFIFPSHSMKFSTSKSGESRSV
jgi:hypothetical protein